MLARAMMVFGKGNKFTFEGYSDILFYEKWKVRAETILDSLAWRSIMSKSLIQQHHKQYARASVAAGTRLFTSAKDPAEQLLLLKRQTQPRCDSLRTCDRSLLGDLLRYKSPQRCVDLMQGQAKRVTFQRPQIPVVQPDDHRIYQQNLDLDAFFGDEQKYEKVSDVVLLNDHYIFVKMAETGARLRSGGTTEEANAASNLPCTSKLSRCFKCSRSSRRISPIVETLEEREVKNLAVQKLKNAWYNQDEVEVFQSRTRITRIEANSKPVNQHQQPTAFASSLRDVVNLELHGQLATPGQEVIVNSKATVRARNRKHSAAASGGNSRGLRLGALHWLLKPFRRRHANAKPVKAKPKINAAVHKTYFVRWTKPPETLWHGYGVERRHEEQPKKSPLRRCRSAVY